MARTQDQKRARPVARGLVWIVIGALIQTLSLVADRPIVVRGTHVPWGIVVVGIGLLLLAWDLRKKRRQ